MSAFVVDGRQVSYQEYVRFEVERERRESARLWELKQTALLLVQKIGEAYREYEQFLEDHPELAMQMPEGQIPNQKLYEQLRENVGRANDAPRCMYVKPDGVRCGSPRLKGGELCYTHQRMERARSLRVRMPALEDGNSILLAIQEVNKALLDHQISSKDAGLLLYGLQTAATKVGKATFHEKPNEMVVEDTEAKIAEKAVPEDTGERYEKYRYETIDPDLRAKLMEIGDEVDRRLAERERAARAAEAEGVLGAGGEAGRVNLALEAPQSPRSPSSPSSHPSPPKPSGLGTPTSPSSGEPSRMLDERTPRYGVGEGGMGSPTPPSLPTSEMQNLV